MKSITSYERTSTHHRYVVSLGDGRSAEVLFKIRRSILGLQAEGGAVEAPAGEDVATFREAADWLGRFIEQDGSPRPDVVASLRGESPGGP